MSYKFEQKIGNKISVYEITSYWDKNKKQPRQKRKYLGRKDSDGNLIPAKSNNKPISVLDYGHVYFVEQIIKELNLKNVIGNNFGEDISNKLLQLVKFQVLENKPLYLYETWVDKIKTNNNKHKLSSQSISKLSHEIGADERNRDLFFKEWINVNKTQEGIFYDITSLSSHSKLIDIVEWGYNRDGENLPQINLGLLLGTPSNLPMFYEIYPGSISDVITIKNMIAKINSYGIKNFTFILDRGFFSQNNISNIYDEVNNFIIPMPFTSKISLELINKDFFELDNILCYKNKAIYHIEKPVILSDKKLYAHVYYDETRKAQEMNRFINIIFQKVESLKNKIFTNIEDCKEYMDNDLKGHKSCFKIIEENNKIFIAKNNEEINKVIKRMGKMVLLTKLPGLSKEKIISDYFEKDIIEKSFDILKNELNENRLKVSSTEALKGRMFLNFLSLIVYSYISNKMKSKKLFKKYTFSEVILELSKIKHIKLSNGKSIISEFSKKQKILFESFNIALPH